MRILQCVSIISMYPRIRYVCGYGQIERGLYANIYNMCVQRSHIYAYMYMYISGFFHTRRAVLSAQAVEERGGGQKKQKKKRLNINFQKIAKKTAPVEMKKNTRRYRSLYISRYLYMYISTHIHLCVYDIYRLKLA